VRGGAEPQSEDLPRRSRSRMMISRVRRIGIRLDAAADAAHPPDGVTSEER
jgi:hypothetical protein